MGKKVSILIPTKNSGDLITKCLKSVDSLDYPKDDLEVIIIDGHSTDKTIEVAERHNCKIVYEDIGTHGAACNVGVKNSEGELVLLLDSDCVVPKEWIKNLLACFNSQKIAAVGGPNITPDDDTDFAKCVGIVLSFLSKPGSRYGLNVDTPMETDHNSGCNSLYIKKTIEEAGWFNEKMITCDDAELDYRIREKGYKIMYTPNAIVYHYRRPTWKRFYKQAYIYGVGRMEAIKLHLKMAKWFHYALPVFFTNRNYAFHVFINKSCPILVCISYIIWEQLRYFNNEHIP